MRPDQFLLLEDLTERICDVLLVEADPVNWAGHGKTPVQMSREERGDRWWSQRNATGTITVLMRLNHILDREANNIALTPPADDVDVDREIARVERQAKEALKRMNERVGKMH